MSGRNGEASTSSGSGSHHNMLTSSTNSPRHRTGNESQTGDVIIVDQNTEIPSLYR